MSDEFFQRLTQQYPDYTPLCQNLTNLKTKKLYYQLTNEILSFVSDPFLSTLPIFSEFYDIFISDISSKLSPLKLTQIVTKIAKQFTNQNEALSFFDSIFRTIEIDLAARCLFYASKAEIYINGNELNEARNLLEKASQMIVGEEGLESVVYSELYRISAFLCYKKQNPNLYYKNAVLFLKYVDLNSLEINEQLELSKNMMISSLIGENVFDFASFLNSPLSKHFEGLEELPGISHNVEELKMFFNLVCAINSGDMVKFNKTLEGLGKLFETDKMLAANYGKIREKASLVCLMELIFRTISTQRTFSFEKIAEVTQVPMNKVEIVVMRAMNLGLVKGFIDQCKNEVTFTWVMPRVLDKNQFMFVREQLGQWEQQTRKTLELLSIQE